MTETDRVLQTRHAYDQHPTGSGLSIQGAGARVNNRMSNPSRRSSSGEPVQLKSSQVMPLAQR